MYSIVRLLLAFFAQNGKFPFSDLKKKKTLYGHSDILSLLFSFSFFIQEVFLPKKIKELHDFSFSNFFASLFLSETSLFFADSLFLLDRRLPCNPKLEGREAVLLKYCMNRRKRVFFSPNSGHANQFSFFYVCNLKIMTMFGKRDCF